jgi:excinuclease ABC subunit B
MYADNETEAMRTAIGETDRRRAIQIAFNEEHGIVPASIQKGVSDIVELLGLTDEPAPSRKARRGEVDALADVGADELERMIIEREQEMFAAAEDLRFELAARLRDEIGDLRREQLERAHAGGEGAGADGEARRPSAPVPRRSARRAAGKRRR